MSAQSHFGCPACGWSSARPNGFSTPSIAICIAGVPDGVIEMGNDAICTSAQFVSARTAVASTSNPIASAAGSFMRAAFFYCSFVGVGGGDIELLLLEGEEQMQRLQHFEADIQIG